MMRAIVAGAAVVVVNSAPMAMWAQSRSSPIDLPPLGSAALAELRAGLGVHTRVLMIGAHPDDEDTPVIAWLARGHHAETAYLSLTRGDGGQNLIGNELGEALGVIRTEELLAARRVDGAHQYFTRAFDFGFSKTADETFTHWPHDSILGDVVKTVRAFRPQIIVSVFSGTPRDGHGHHQVAGIVAREAYDAAGDTVRFPTRAYGPAWEPLKFYRGTYFTPELATVRINTGAYNENLGRSYFEIAAESRSQHKSQGFGTTQRKGAATSSLMREGTRVNASTEAKAETSMFDGLDTARVVTDADRDLLSLAESQVAVEAIAERPRVALGDSVAVRVSVYRHGVMDSTAARTMYVHGTQITQPYWLEQSRHGDLFAVASDSVPDDERQKSDWIAVPVPIPGRMSPIIVRAPVVYRYADPVRGDVQRPLAVVPAISATFSRDVALARAGGSFDRELEVTVRSGMHDTATVTLRLGLPSGLGADSATRTVVVAPYATRTMIYRITGRVSAGTTNISLFRVDSAAQTGADASAVLTGYVPIEYDHIAPQRMYRLAQLHVEGIDAVLPAGLNVGYVAGVGDNVAPALHELGVPVTMIDPVALPVTNLSRFTTIVVGPRAYQASQTLINNNGYLLAYVRAGGNLVVQYGQNEMQRSGVMPYAIELARPAARVTVENVPVTVLDPKSPLLRTPNRIMPADFDGWVQERATYMPTTFDSRYTPVLQMNDPGESPNRAALLTTAYGKGRYTYVTLALFRQVPAGVSGGVRLFANLLK